MIACIYSFLLSHSFLDRHLSCFYFLAIVHNASVEMEIPPTLVSILLDVYPGLELLNHTVILFLIFWGTAILVYYFFQLQFTFNIILYWFQVDSLTIRQLYTLYSVPLNISSTHPVPYRVIAILYLICFTLPPRDCFVPTNL